MAFFGQKWKKQGWILIGNKKFALWKCLYFCSKMHVGQVISHFVFFSWYPFRGILVWEYWPKLKSEKWNAFIFVNYNRNFMSIINFWQAHPDICLNICHFLYQILRVKNKQDLVFSVQLHLGLIPYPLTLIPYPWLLSPGLYLVIWS